MAQQTDGRRPRQQFSEEFKEGAVRLVLDEDQTVGAVARDLDLTLSALALWVRQAQAERTKGKSGLMREEREELARVRKENRELRVERDILKKPPPSSPSIRSDLRHNRRGEGPLSRAHALSDARRVAERVLCVADPASVPACARRPSAQRAAARLVYGRARVLRQSPHSR